METTKTYLIFVDKNDIFNFVRIECTRTELNSKLISEELMKSGDDWRDMDWVIFEDGNILWLS